MRWRDELYNDVIEKKRGGRFHGLVAPSDHECVRPSPYPVDVLGIVAQGFLLSLKRPEDKILW